jgi:hypothetical protein
MVHNGATIIPSGGVYRGDDGSDCESVSSTGGFTETIEWETAPRGTYTVEVVWNCAIDGNYRWPFELEISLDGAIEGVGYTWIEAITELNYVYSFEY